MRLGELRRLTNDGASGAPSWHPDGRSIVFERRRAADGCSQLHRMDLQTGETQQLSPDDGWASSGRYGGEPLRLLFSYAASPKPPCRNGFAGANATSPTWSLAPSEIWALADGDEAPAALIQSPAYDGEPDLAPDGSVVFTSTRDGNPELYVATPDGSGVTRITTAAGYDGSPSLSRDGSKLVWHAERLATPDRDAPTAEDRAAGESLAAPRSLRVFVAGHRGQHPRPLTALGSYDMTPVFMPANQRILFASDYDASGSGEFDLYLIDPDAPQTADGRPVVERVTYAPGFDGAAQISPDGRWLVFASSRSSATPGGTDVYVARWSERDGPQ